MYINIYIYVGGIASCCSCFHDQVPSPPRFFFPHEFFAPKKWMSILRRLQRCAGSSFSIFFGWRHLIENCENMKLLATKKHIALFYRFKKNHFFPYISFEMVDIPANYIGLHFLFCQVTGLRFDGECFRSSGFARLLWMPQRLPVVAPPSRLFFFPFQT